MKLGLIAVLVVVLALQTWAIVSLRGDLTEMRETVQAIQSAEEMPVPAPMPGSDRIGAEPGASFGSGAARPDAFTPAAGPEPGALPGALPDEQVLDEAVGRALQRVELARLDQLGERWTRAASDHLQVVLEDMVAEGRLRDEVNQDAHDLLLGEMYEVWDLKADVRRGAIDEADATAEYEEIHAAYVAALTELVGEETATELFEHARRAGKGE
ncbi:MAG: hypothetical protein JRJ84_08660 [Deltaproteobacteria bacterium]|nr:hypothetical protein [Deltaproteobacteria bacterium]